MEQQLTVRQKRETLRTFLMSNKQSVQDSLPKFLSAERLIGQLFTTINMNPALMDATPRSLIGALLYCGSLALDPGPLGLVYIVPFNNRKKGCIEAQTIIGYKGLVALARRSDLIDILDAGVAYEGDEFKFDLGTDPFIHYKPDHNRTEFGNPNDILWAWSFYRLKGSSTSQCTVISKSRIEWHRNMYSKAKDSGPWVNNFEAMAMKTAIRMNLKLAPMQVDTQSAIAMDEMAESSLSQESFMPELTEQLEEKIQKSFPEESDQQSNQVSHESADRAVVPDWAPAALRLRPIDSLTNSEASKVIGLLEKRLMAQGSENNPFRKKDEKLFDELKALDIKKEEPKDKVKKEEIKKEEAKKEEPKMDIKKEEVIIEEKKPELVQDRKYDPAQEVTADSIPPKQESTQEPTPGSQGEDYIRRLKLEAERLSISIRSFKGGGMLYIDLLDSLRIKSINAANEEDLLVLIQKLTDEIEQQQGG